MSRLRSIFSLFLCDGDSQTCSKQKLRFAAGSWKRAGIGIGKHAGSVLVFNIVL